MGPIFKGAAIRFFSVMLGVTAGVFFAAHGAIAGTADNVTGWGWSGTIGWISLNCTNDATCATADYGLAIDNTPGFPDRGDLTGWAWSETMGWICFGTTCTGTTPEGGAPYAQYRGTFNGKQDQFWGWAQVLSLGANGWISLNCDKDVGVDDCATSNYHVVLNNVDGNFTKGGATDHWAWSSNTDGTGVGWIDLSIANTSWVLADLGTVRRPQGVFEPQPASPPACVTDAQCTTPPLLKCDTVAGTCTYPGTRQHKLSVTFLGFSAAVNQFLECELVLPDVSKRIVNKVIGSTVRGGTTTLDYTVVPADAIQQNNLWYLNKCLIAGYANGSACTSDAQCAVGTEICDETAAKCREIIDSTTSRKPVFAHGNTWTGLDAQQDQYLAIKCNAGFPDNYFKNAAQCDFTGDAAFALAMRRGIPIEGNCGDGIDNDGNGTIDCADRYCKGVSYICTGQTLPRTRCVWGQTGDGIIDCSDAAYAQGSGTLCCTRQGTISQPGLHQIVDGLECTAGDANDGYFDCSCVSSAQYNVSGTDDCFSPGAQSGDLCCSATNDVTKKP
jgi:hypothetical protein